MEIASFTDPCEEHFHIFMPSSFPLKAVKGGLWILHGMRRLMRSPLCVKMDQWNKTRKLLAEPGCTPEWDDSWVGQWDRRWVGVNSKRESAVVPLLYLLPLFFLFSFDFCWPKSTWGHLLTDGSFFFSFPLCFKARYEKLPHSNGLALIIWQKLSLHTAVLGPSYRVQTMHMGTAEALHGILISRAPKSLGNNTNQINKINGGRCFKWIHAKI